MFVCLFVLRVSVCLIVCLFVIMFVWLFAGVNFFLCPCLLVCFLCPFVYLFLC